MAWQSGGGLPAGISSDGNQGLRVAGALTAGTPGGGAALQHSFSGAVSVLSGQAELDNVLPTLSIEQTGTMDGDRATQMLAMTRNVDHGAFHLTAGAIGLVENSTGLPADELILNLAGIVSYIAGGLGLFYNFPQTAVSSLTGALSTVTDPAAKAVLTALVAAATADGSATNNTT